MKLKMIFMGLREAIRELFNDPQINLIGLGDSKKLKKSLNLTRNESGFHTRICPVEKSSLRIRFWILISCQNQGVNDTVILY